VQDPIRSRSIAAKPALLTILHAGSYQECTALTYAGGYCSLHSSLSYTYTMMKLVEKQPRKLVFIKKQVPDSGHSACASNYGGVASTAHQMLDECIAQRPNVENRITTQLRRLAIILSVTENWRDARKGGFDSVVSNLQCYCDMHKYQFVSSDYYYDLHSNH
jgi:hypothetical protein